MWPSSMPAMASRAASLASAWITDAPPSAFGSRIASGSRRHDGVEVGVGEAGGDAVDAHQQARALRLRHRVLDERRGARARGILAVDRDRILEVDDHGVGAARERLVEL